MVPEAAAKSPLPAPPPSETLATKELEPAAGGKGGPDLKVT